MNGMTATHAYVGYCGICGSMVAASVDIGKKCRIDSDIVAFVRAGYRVEQVTIEAAKDGLAKSNCECAPRESDHDRAQHVAALSEVTP